ncbi:unnamed protein product [Staurois parvus]|uniref:Immunoglobulin C1-set domain-containing protein n=1 Tax=Staurois parvus TaxID=386267 RepID=A0ABN9AHM6_9NEOB|nr:unnamed protein product [Staurois parvus]
MRILTPVSIFSPPEPPQVYVYTRNPVEIGKKNQLLCHCTNFHPPRIELQLKAANRELPDCHQSDMTFKEDWAYFLTKSVDFTPEEGVEYSCDVRHNDGTLKTYRLGMSHPGGGGGGTTSVGNCVINGQIQPIV